LRIAVSRSAQPEIGHEHGGDQRHRRGLEDIVANPRRGTEREQRPDPDDGRQPTQAHGQARLQDEPVERQDRQAIEAARGQPALAAELDQHALAIGLVLEQPQPAIDAAAVGGGREAQQIDRLHEQHRGGRREQIDHIGRIQVERHRRHSGLAGSK
jgi:hypothetical protein